MIQIPISDLSLEELQRVQNTLEKRFGIGKRGNILQLGYGVAEFEKSGQLDWNRPSAVCFYVSRKTKSQPKNRHDRIPPDIRVRVRRGSRYVQLVAPTDVIVVNRKKYSLSGRSISYRKLESATTGVLLAWRPRGRVRLTWGVLSVGHTFPDTIPLPDQHVHVKIGGSPTIPGRFFARGTSNDLDTSLTIVRRDDLVRSNIISESFEVSKIEPRPVSRLREDAGKFGTTRPRSRNIPFQVLRFLLSAPIFSSVLGFSPRHVMHVGQSAHGSFQLGTSGSIWRIDGQLACLQFATYRPQFDQGFGLCLEDALDWVQLAISKTLDVPFRDTDVRLVAIF